ncbi:regucalcin-like isoform X2 [Cylas formicarius]|uniref:regucalcin-like isoform X2 n=1 Tax=Cylas formicarius TaxID=197179 RepID=UPI002958B4F8|nr:regucalcin-like isoform X2 [Cylas formicarius]
MVNFLWVFFAIVVPYFGCSSAFFEVSQETEPAYISESIFYDAKTEHITYADILNSIVYRKDVREQKSYSLKIPEKSIGAVIPIEGKENEYVVAAHQSLYRLYWDSKGDKFNLTKLRLKGETTIPGQFNDGKADAKGRLWIGTRKLKSSYLFDFVQNAAVLYSITLNDDNSATLVKKLSGLTFPNGIAWSANNKFMWHVEATTKQVKRYPFDLEKGELGQGKVVFDLNQHKKFKGFPDGLVSYQDDTICIALYNGSAILHIEPESGKILQELPLPLAQPTGLYPGGPDNNIVYAGTSRYEITEEYFRLNPFEYGSVLSVSGFSISLLPAFKVKL